MTTLTRIYRFSASHRLHSPGLSPDQNAALYGKCNNPFGHGHDYRLEVTALGEVDGANGLILPVAQLDRLVEEQVLRLFASRNINLDVPQFLTLVPTTENIALVIAGLLKDHWRTYLGDSRAHLDRVHVQETDRNGFEILFSTPSRNTMRNHRTEGVTTHA